MISICAISCPGCDPNFPYGCHPKKAVETTTSYDTAGKHEKVEEHMPPYPNQIRCILTAEQLQNKFEKCSIAGRLQGGFDIIHQQCLAEFGE